jgi:UDPglucose 6-dehydrogenase
MRIAVVGAGHVGLVTGAALASLGHEVSCTDADSGKLAALSDGVAPFAEPGLDDLIADGLASGRLRFTPGSEEAVGGADVVFVCVGRPPAGRGDRSLTAVEDAVREVARHARDGVVVVVKSTVPPGTTERVEGVIRRERPDLAFAAASSPEFLREGRAVADTLAPDRLVVGADGDRARAILRELYAPLLERGVPLIETDPRSAELAKLASNAFLATKVSFANALARIADGAGADVREVTAIMGADPRIGPAFLGPGLGYGGYCLPKDVATLERVADRLGYDFALLREVARVNEEALEAVARRVEEAVWNLEGKRIALLGLAFKGGTDDVRGAPALVLARRLLAEGAVLAAWDPLAGEAARREVPELELFPDPYRAAVGAHCAVVCTDWPELAELDLLHLANAMATPCLVDGRNAIDAAAARAAGIAYHAVGRRGTEPAARGA